MAEIVRAGAYERDIEQAITALKKGAHLLKYSRKGKPRFCPFRLSADEKNLIWLAGKEEMQVSLDAVSRIIPGQRTANFQRNPMPEKEYQSFSLIYGPDDQSLDLICKDKDQAELWFVGLKALISNGQFLKVGMDTRNGTSVSSDGYSPLSHVRKTRTSGSSTVNSNSSQQDFGDPHGGPYGSPPQDGLEKKKSTAALNAVDLRKSYADMNLATDAGAFDTVSESVKFQLRDNGTEAFRISLSSIISSSSHGSGQDDLEALGDVYLWGEGIGDGFLGGGACKIENGTGSKMDALLPKHLESAVVLDVHNISCGMRHAALVSRQGEVFCWGEESGGRLGHGVDMDVAHPQLVETLANTSIEHVACGEYHTCAITLNGDLYTWGDGTRSFGLLGQDNEFSHWMPRRVYLSESIRISSVACGPWHTALISSAGQLFTFGDGTFGALGHGDKVSVFYPKEVDTLKGLKTVRTACGLWHTAAVVEVIMGCSDVSNCPSGKLFTWGDGDKGRLGHGDKEQKLVPKCVAALVDHDFRQVACGHSLTVALTMSGTIFTMGSPVYGQLGDPHATGQHPLPVEGKLWDAFVEEIACGSHHVVALTSKTEVYTWGKGANGRLGHGDIQDRHSPTLVEALKDKQVKSISCGTSFTAAVCLHKWLSGADQSVCSGCRLSFSFTRKRHNCYNCGHVFCHGCSSKKAYRAMLAPSPKKPYRVCDPCYIKLKLGANAGAKQQEDKSLLKQVKRPDSLRRISPAPVDVKLRSIGSLPDAQSLLPIHPLSPVCTPAPRTLALANSPTSRLSSPPNSTTPPARIASLKSPDFLINELRKKNKNLTQELSCMQAQIDSLTKRCQNQEAELQRAMSELEVATSLAADEAAKCKAAKEVIRCLTIQLKDLAENLPLQVHDYGGATALSLAGDLGGVSQPSFGVPEIEGICFRNQKHSAIKFVRSPDCNGVSGPRGTVNGTLHLPQQAISHSRLTEQEASADFYGGKMHGLVSPKFHDDAWLANKSMLDAKDTCTPGTVGREMGVKNTDGSLNESSVMRSSGSQPHLETEWVKQHEPGVYITFTSLPGGGKDLKRVRFSRKKFSEKQAEQWWAENRIQVYEQYNVRGMNNSLPLAPVYDRIVAS